MFHACISFVRDKEGKVGIYFKCELSIDNILCIHIYYSINFPIEKFPLTNMWLQYILNDYVVCDYVTGFEW